MSRPARIALVGFMGSGKTTVGRAVAASAGYSFADTDELIEAEQGTTVSALFKERGEPSFRDLEREAVRRLLDREGCVMATGGGAFAQTECARDLLARAFVVHLHCEFDEAFRRAREMGGRPLAAAGEASARALYADRKDKYSRAHVTIDTTHRSPGEVAAEVLRVLPQDS